MHALASTALENGTEEKPRACLLGSLNNAPRTHKSPVSGDGRKGFVFFSGGQGHRVPFLPLGVMGGCDLKNNMPFSDKRQVLREFANHYSTSDSAVICAKKSLLP
jgi:hypothetical protein